MEGVKQLEDEKIAHQALSDAETLRILTELSKRGGEGLSNAEIDSMLNTASQWLIFWRLRRLMALGFVKYDVQLFGEPGKYLITEKGLSAIKPAG